MSLRDAGHGLTSPSRPPLLGPCPPLGSYSSCFPDISCDDIFRLETSRLWLRWLRAGDAAAVTAFASQAEVAQMTASIPHPYPPGEAERFVLAARAGDGGRPGADPRRHAEEQGPDR